ncbi:hypothetical protein H2198_005080 [Neophaeococcomyces mojaviensis]|uniref:Uncharacterized protein n=1 Tax=Neophaeococcomyces mojaviensis TaxID=3383035 RepID=A0ACC3A6L7_9EURO|nr:hypothetical protein H2198_005080 [Knufia sp. JES_112]
MHDLGGDVSFPFVNYDGPKLTHDTSIRRLIRRQAMRDVAAIRKQRGGYGQQNLRQYPVFLEQVTNADDSSLQVKIPVQSVISICAHSNTPSDQDRSGSFEQLKENRVASCRRGFLLPTPIVHSDLVMAQKFSLLLNHTPLTGLRLGIAKFSLPDFEYTDETDDLFTTHAGSRKLLYSIPSRYGKVSSVSHATDCVVARLSQMMQFPQKRTKDSEATALLHYTKALRALQAALADDIQRMAPETLCATVLLGIFEVSHVLQ